MRTDTTSPHIHSLPLPFQGSEPHSVRPLANKLLLPLSPRPSHPYRQPATWSPSRLSSPSNTSLPPHPTTLGPYQST